MKAIINAIHTFEPGFQALAPNPYLIPICNRPVIEYQMEALYNIGVREVRIILHQQGSALEAHVGKGERWGLNVDYQLGNFLDSPEKLLVKNAHFVQGQDLVYLEGLVFPQTHSETQLDIPLAKQEQCMWISQQEITGTILDHLPIKGSEAPFMKVGILNHLKSYFELNMQLMKNPSQFNVHFYRSQGNLSIGKRTQAPKNLNLTEHNLLGNFVKLQKEVVLNNAIIGDDVSIGKGTEINHSIILGKTQVGQGLYLHRKIVIDNQIIDPDTQTQLSLDEPHWLRQQYNLKDTCLWLFKVGVTLPLLCVMAPLFYLLQHGIPQIKRVALLPNNKGMITYPEYLPQNKLTHKMFVGLKLHKWPLLPFVLQGKLSLGGHTLQHEQGDLLPEDIPEYTPGVFGFSEVNQAQGEQSNLDTLFYSSQVSQSNNFKIFLKGIFGQASVQIADESCHESLIIGSN